MNNIKDKIKKLEELKKKQEELQKSCEHNFEILTYTIPEKDREKHQDKRYVFRECKKCGYLEYSDDAYEDMKKPIFAEGDKKFYFDEEKNKYVEWSKDFWKYKENWI